MFSAVVQKKRSRNRVSAPVALGFLWHHLQLVPTKSLTCFEFQRCCRGRRCVDLATCTPSVSAMKCSSDLLGLPSHVPRRQRTSNLRCVAPFTPSSRPAPPNLTLRMPSFDNVVGRVTVELDYASVQQPGVLNDPREEWMRDVDVDDHRLFQSPSYRVLSFYQTIHELCCSHAG